MGYRFGINKKGNVFSRLLFIFCIKSTFFLSNVSFRLDSFGGMVRVWRSQNLPHPFGPSRPPLDTCHPPWRRHPQNLTCSALEPAQWWSNSYMRPLGVRSAPKVHLRAVLDLIRWLCSPRLALSLICQTSAPEESGRKSELQSVQQPDT